MQFIYIVIMSWFSLAIKLSVVIAYAHSDLFTSRNPYFVIGMYNNMGPYKMAHMIWVIIEILGAL